VSEAETWVLLDQGSSKIHRKNKRLAVDLMSRDYMAQLPLL